MIIISVSTPLLTDRGERCRNSMLIASFKQTLSKPPVVARSSIGVGYSNFFLNSSPIIEDRRRPLVASYL